jgi:hypothetical protein
VRREALLGAVAALLLTGAARAGQFTFAHGALLGVQQLGADGPLRVIDLRTGATRWRLPPGVVAGDMLVHQDGSLLTWFDASRGTRTGDAVVQPRGAFRLVGASQDGTRAVVARTQTRSTTFELVSIRARRLVKLGGHDWAFVALNGPYLFLAEHGKRLRLYDLARNTLQTRPLGVATGAPAARVSSPDGRYIFTLYGEAHVQELDTAAGFAYTVDLTGGAPWGLVADAGNDTLWAVSPGLGRVVGIDVPAHAVRLHYSFRAGRWNDAPVFGMLAPDGDRILFTDAQHLWVAVPGKTRVIDEPSHVVTAVGWAPDESRVWVVGERSRVSPLRLRLR